MKNKKVLISIISVACALVVAAITTVCLVTCKKNDTPATEKEIGDMLKAENAYKIVLPEDATATEEYSAEQIAYYYEQVGGKQMQIVKGGNETLGENSSIISLGDTSVYKAAEEKHGKVDLSESALNADGFVIFTYGNNVLINAYNDRGIMYGAFELIEHTFGVKFLTEDYTHVPHSSEIMLKTYDKTYRPAFKQRAYLNTSVFSKKTEYVAHMRFNTDYCPMPENMGGSTKWHEFGNPAHTFPGIVSLTEYLGDDGQITPDYRAAFAHLGSGKGMTTYKATDGTVLDLCYTSGIKEDGTGDIVTEKTAFKMVTDSLKSIILADEESEWYMLGQADRPMGCPCDDCKNARVKYEASGLMIRFVNAVNAEIQRWIKSENLDRNIKFCLFAYDYTERAPLDSKGEILDASVVPADNVYIKYAPIHSIYYYSLNDERQNDETKGVYESWAKVTNHLMTWTYATWYAESFWYYPTMQTFADTMKLLYDSGNEYTFVQGLYYEKNIYQQNIDAYVLSKLFWDLDADVEAIRNEFLYYYFGEDAYENMLTFHRLIDVNYAMIADNGAVMLSYAGNFWSDEYWRIQTMNTLVDLFENSIKAVNADGNLIEKQKADYVTNLEKAELMPGYMRLYNARRYGLDDANVKKLATEWVSLAEKYGVLKTGENDALTIEAVKVKYGVG